MDKLHKQLIESIINQDDAKAKELFHKFVVEKAREIYESMEEADQVGDFIDDVDSDETGGDDFGDDDLDFDAPNFADEDPAAEMDDTDTGLPDDDLEDRVIDLEDELDKLQAEFEELLAKESEEDEPADFGDDDLDVEDEGQDEFAADEDEDEVVKEAVELKKVTVTHPGPAANVKSPVAGANKIAGAGAPVKTSTAVEKGRAAPAVKPTIGAVRNSPNQASAKLQAAPKPKVNESIRAKRK